MTKPTFEFNEASKRHLKSKAPGDSAKPGLNVSGRARELGTKEGVAEIEAVLTEADMIAGSSTAGGAAEERTVRSWMSAPAKTCCISMAAITTREAQDSSARFVDPIRMLKIKEQFMVGKPVP